MENTKAFMYSSAKVSEHESFIKYFTYKAPFVL